MLTYKSSITLSEYLKIFSRLSGNFIKNKKDDKELILSTMNETFPSSLRFDGGAHIANGAFIENIFPIPSINPLKAENKPPKNIDINS